MDGMLWYEQPESAAALLGAEQIDIAGLAKLMYRNLPLAGAEPAQLLKLLSADPRTLELRREYIKALCGSPELFEQLCRLCFKMEQWAELSSNVYQTAPHDALECTVEYEPLLSSLELICKIRELTEKQTAQYPALTRLSQALDELDGALKLSAVTRRSREIMSGIEHINSFKFELELDEFLRLRRYRLAQINDYTYKAKGRTGHRKEDISTPEHRRIEAEHSKYENVAEEKNAFSGPGLNASLIKNTLAAIKYDRVWKLGAADSMGKLINAGANNGWPDSEALVETVLAMERESLVNSKTVATSMLRRISAALRPLHDGLALVLGGANAVMQLRKTGLPLCWAEGGEAFEAKQLWLPQLLAAVKPENIVKNDVNIAQNGFCVLTGANEGGKTTYLRSVGVAAVMNALGLPVCAESACIADWQGLVCVFSDRENIAAREGRIVQELQLTAGALEAAGSGCLVLLNEPITATAETDAQTITESVLNKLIKKGARGVLVTHLHGLAARLYNTAGFDSLVAVCESGDVTYRVERRAPEGSSHAYDAVARKNINFA